MKKIVIMISCIATILAGCNNNTDNIQQETKDSEEVIQPNAQATFEVVEEETGNKFINGHEFVDLGLRTKWATCNVGANEPHEYGNYYAWGETTTKNSYTEANSKTLGKSVSDMNCDDIGGYESYDAATANWGKGCRMPSRLDMKELEERCTWTWTTENDVNGFKVTGPNGNSIFLPAAGIYDTELSDVNYGCYYLTSTIYKLNDNSNAYREHACPGVSDGLNSGGREFGYSVRPVTY